MSLRAIIASWGSLIVLILGVFWLVVRRMAKKTARTFDPARERAKAYHMIRDIWDFIYNEEKPCEHPRLYPMQRRLDEFFHRTKGLAISFDSDFRKEYMGEDDPELFKERAGISPENLYTHQDKTELEQWLKKDDWHIFPLDLYWKLIKGAISNTCQSDGERTDLIKKLLPMMRIIDLDEKLDD